MTATVPDSVVVRIQKLMEIRVERGASEQEAAMATATVQRMLAEHNISMAHIEAKGGSTGADGKRSRENVKRRQVYRWQRDLMYALAELNYCKALQRFQHRFRGPDIFDGYDLIGRMANVMTTQHMFDYLVSSIERLARDDVGNDPTQFFTKYAHSFKEGCAHRVVERLRRKREEMLEEQTRKQAEERARSQHPGAAPSNAVAIYLHDVIQSEEDLNNDIYRGWEPGTTARNRAQEEADRALRQGKIDAAVAEARARGVSEEILSYMQYGYSEERARALIEPSPAKEEKPETDAQRRKRQEREERAHQRWREQQDRRQYREAARIDQRAYRKGAQAGDSVGLDPQVGKGSSNRRLS